MKILLLNPPGLVLKAGTRWSSKIKKNNLELGYYPFPFYLAYAAALLQKANHQVLVVDAVAMSLSESKTLEKINSFNPEIVAVETSATSYIDDLKFLEKIVFKTVAIGSHATGNVNKCIEDGYHFVISGEYEQPLCHLLDFLEKKTELPDYIISKYSKKKISIYWHKDLNEFPWPARDLFDLHKYNEPVAGGRNIVMTSSRGCILKCNFCTVPLAQGGSHWRARNISSVVDELEYLVNHYKYDEVYFDDDNMTANSEHVLNICREIKKRNLKCKWGCMGDAFIDVDLISIMAEAGCILFKFGVEHNDLHILKEIPKNIKQENVKKIFVECKKYGIRTHPTFIVGLPGSNVEKDLKMIDYALSLRPTTLQFSVYSPFPGTKAYTNAEQNTWLVTNKWSMIDGAGRSIISYPNYNWIQITKMHCYAWDKWQRHFILKQPRTVIHHFLGLLKREGIFKTIKTIYYTLKQQISYVLINNLIDKNVKSGTKDQIVDINTLIFENLLEVLKLKKIKIWHHCSGKGDCTTCIIQVISGKENLSIVTDKENDKLTENELKYGYRLACQTKVKGKCQIMIPRDINIL